MINVFSAVILLLFLVQADLSLAQSNLGSSKVYSGFLHQITIKRNASFWHVFFGGRAPQKDIIIPDKECSIEFRSPVSFSHQSVSVMPEQLTYSIKCTQAPPFERFTIKIYDNKDEEYSIDPKSEGRQVGINDEHHIADSYLIYLIMGRDIDHLELVSSAPDAQDKYVLDKVEVYDNH